MIPICDKIGRICAFTARKLEQTPEWGDRKSPKYINSETPIFEKGNLLFNLHLANKEISEILNFYWLKASWMRFAAGIWVFAPWSPSRHCIQG